MLLYAITTSDKLGREAKKGSDKKLKTTFHVKNRAVAAVELTQKTMRVSSVGHETIEIELEA